MIRVLNISPYGFAPRIDAIIVIGDRMYIETKGEYERFLTGWANSSKEDLITLMLGKGLALDKSLNPDDVDRIRDKISKIKTEEMSESYFKNAEIGEPSTWELIRYIRS